MLDIQGWKKADMVLSLWNLPSIKIEINIETDNK